MSSIVDSWEAFFRNSGLPSNVRRKYAQRFVKERIQPNMLRDIGKSELRELGVEAIGDQLCILRYIKSSDGILDEFKTANKQQTSSASLDNNDDDDMDINDEIPAAPRTVTMKSAPSSSRAKTIQRREPPVVAPRISSQSRVIRKKPVMIHDVSSSSLALPAVGKMRSDLISLKTTVVDTNSAKKTPEKSLVSRRGETSSQNPDFRVRLNVRPQLAYNTFLDEDNGDEDDDNEAMEESARFLAPKPSRIISVTDGRRRMEGAGPEVRRLPVPSISLGGGRPIAGASINVRRSLATATSASNYFANERLAARRIAPRTSLSSSSSSSLGTQKVSMVGRRVAPSIQLLRGGGAVGGGAARHLPIQARVERRTKPVIAATPSASSGILSRISMVTKR